MPDVTIVKAFFDLGGLVVLAGVAIWSVYKLAIYAVEQQKANAVILHTVIETLTDTIERNTESNTKLHEAILSWDRHLQRIDGNR
jgi:hypothetical protein